MIGSISPTPAPFQCHSISPFATGSADDPGETDSVSSTAQSGITLWDGRTSGWSQGRGRVVVRRIVGLALALSLVPPGSTVAQQPAALLCVAVIGSTPTVGWTPQTLTDAISDGSATIQFVTDPGSCSGPDSSTTHTLTGSVTIPRATEQRNWRISQTGGCYGVNDFEHVLGLVTVQTLLGEELASGYFDTGGGVIDGTQGTCTFTFTVLDVPAAVDYVVVFAGGPHMVIPAQQMDALGWRLDVTAGPTRDSWIGPLD